MNKKRKPEIPDKDDSVVLPPDETDDEARLLLEELASLAKATGPAIYRRIVLIERLLRIPQFMTAYPEGDEQAMKSLQERYVQDLGGLMPVALQVDIYRMFPSESYWEEKRYNLAVLRAEYEEKTKAHKQEALGTRNHGPSKKELNDKLTNAERKLDRAKNEVDELRKEVAKLKEENQKLRRENAEFKGRVKALEKRLKDDEAIV